MNALNLMANSYVGVAALAASVLGASTASNNGAHIAAMLISHGLMQPIDEATGQVSAAVTLIDLLAKVKGTEPYDEWLEFLSAQTEDVAAFSRGICIECSKHIMFGEDSEDADSVGGFCQREIDMLVNFALVQTGQGQAKAA